jgi:hypothetical protein
MRICLCKKRIIKIPVFICLRYLKNIEAFQSVHHIRYILCYTLLRDFASLVFSLIRVHKALWDDITQGKQ